MIKTGKAVRAIGACVIALGIFGASFAYADNIGNSNERATEELQTRNISIEMNQIEDYELYLEEILSVKYNGKSTDEESEIVVENKYGEFSVLAKNGKVKKFKLGDNDTSEKYLIKGTAEFSKKDISFDGYFLVDNTLTGNRKGQVTMYKGKIDLPNGDKFNGYLSSGKYYSSGTYKWKNGQSYKGKFTTTNKIGTKSLGENVTSSYGTFYFDSTKKKYLFIRFVNGVPKRSGYYKTASAKYLVTFDDNGNCISTSVVK